MKNWKFVDVGNIKVMNAYGWMESHGHLEYYNPDIPFGGHTKGFVEKSKNGYIGAKTNGPVIISKKEFSTEQEAKKYVENKKVGNRVGSLFTEEERANIALGRYEEAKKRGYGVDYEKKLAKEEIQTLEKIAKGEAKYMGFEEKDIPDAKKAIEIYKKIVRNKKTLNIATGNESIDKQEWSMFSGLKKDAEKEIGNRESLVGKYVWVRSKGEEWKCYVLQDKGNKLYIQDTDGHLGWVSIDRVTGVVKNKKTGNEETKAERKFGKVMGEFEEGTLKTPQGKTVTDPAQAKAIAYSEADKVDNLKRARNAMKTGNEKTVTSFKVDVEQGDEQATIEVYKDYDGRWKERIDSGKLSGFRGANYMGYLKPRDIMIWLKRDFDYVGSYYDEDFEEVENKKATNKKCGNAQITLWKGNDTVLISEDGTVQYLESNSFEVDRDKYDSQKTAIEEMTKHGYRKK